MMRIWLAELGLQAAASSKAVERNCAHIISKMKPENDFGRPGLVLGYDLRRPPGGRHCTAAHSTHSSMHSELRGRNYDEPNKYRYFIDLLSKMA